MLWTSVLLILVSLAHNSRSQAKQYSVIAVNGYLNYFGSWEKLEGTGVGPENMTFA